MSYRSVWSRQRKLRGMELLEPRMMLAAQPVISEFMASNSSSIEDGFGHHSDWIELHNAGDASIDLQGYYLTDSISNLTKWSFSAPTVLNPDDYLIVFASDLNTIDPGGYYHTNYKLSAEGEDLALVAPDLTILSQFGPNGQDYPPQLTDISYGLGGPVLVNGSSPARYLIPTNGNLGFTWTDVNFNAAANGFASGKAAIGYDTVPAVDYSPYIQTTVPTTTTSVYIRSEFNLPSAGSVSNMNLNLKYDDGIVVYLNGHKIISQFAPASPVYNSIATGGHADATVIAGENFSLAPYLAFLQTGKNVLAIQLLNLTNSSDLLVDPLLTADYGASTSGYLSTPTPGTANSAVIDIGPIIDPVNFSPNNPADNQTITVTAHVAQVAAPIDATSVKLVYRVMYGSETQVLMVDNGTLGDAVAGDGTYTAQIPETAFVAGQMVRWYIKAADTNGTTSRAPRFLDSLDSAEYYGTVIVDPSVTTTQPVIYWFVQDPNAAATDTGTRASLSMNGVFYDNIEVDLHGQSTTQPQFTKKSFNFDANSGNKFEIDPDFGTFSDFNLLTNQTDKTYLRNTLAYEVYRVAGGPAQFAYSVVVQRNGTYYGMYDVVEEGDEEFLERVGLDPNGALYKMGNAFDSSTNLVEKRTRNYEGNSDLQQLVNTASLNATQGEIWVDDNLDLASWVNYFAVQTLIANRDYGQKNYFLYRDSDGTQQWSLLPWDMDLSFGHQWNQAENYFDDDLIFNDGLYVYQGGNHLIDRLRSLPAFNQMYTRRLRSLIDEFYGPPGGSIEDSYIADRFDELIAQVGADALIDRNKWALPAGMAYETPTQAIARVKQDFLAKRKTYLNSLSSIPTSQVANPNITFGTVDYNPVGGNQAQEFIAVVNSSSVAVDISGWTVTGTTQHTFEGGTVIPANSTYYLVADVAQFKVRTTGPTGGQKLLIQGNYDGELSNSFGTLSLKNTVGATIASTSYGTPPLFGDYDSSGTVDNLDYDLWTTTFGSTSDLRADGNGNHVVDAADYSIWRDHLGTSFGFGSGSGAVAAFAESTDLGQADSSMSALFAWDLSLPSLSAQGQTTSNAPPRLRSLAAEFGTLAESRELALLAAFADRDVVNAQPNDELFHDHGDDEGAIDVALAEMVTLSAPIL